MKSFRKAWQTSKKTYLGIILKLGEKLSSKESRPHLREKKTPILVNNFLHFLFIYFFSSFFFFVI